MNDEFGEPLTKEEANARMRENATVSGALSEAEYEAFKTFFFFWGKYAYMGPSWVNTSEDEEEPNHMDVIFSWWDRVRGLSIESWQLIRTT